MLIKKFEDIIAWQKAKQLNSKLYNLLRLNRDFSYKDQIIRASISIMNNIAEGFERKGNKELKNFLFIAKGSCGEVRSMLYIGISQRYFSQLDFDRLHENCNEISKLLSGFIKTL